MNLYERWWHWNTKQKISCLLKGSGFSLHVQLQGSKNHRFLFAVFTDHLNRLRLEFGCDPNSVGYDPTPPPFFFFISLESGMTNDKPNFFAHIFGVVLGWRKIRGHRNQGHVFRSFWSYLAWSFFGWKCYMVVVFHHPFSKNMCVSVKLDHESPGFNRSENVFQNIGGFATVSTVWMDHLVGGWTNPSEKYARQNGFIFPK